jgi:hypothetical protein
LRELLPDFAQHLVVEAGQLVEGRELLDAVRSPNHDFLRKLDQLENIFSCDSLGRSAHFEHLVHLHCSVDHHFNVVRCSSNDI